MVVSEASLAAYQLESRGRVGRPFKGRPGEVDTAHVRVRLLFAPADGRGYDSIWLQYLSQGFVLDLDLTKAKPFKWTHEPFEDLRPDTTPPGGRLIRLWNARQVARVLGVRGDLLDRLLTDDATLPRPVVAFYDGGAGTPIGSSGGWPGIEWLSWQGRASLRRNNRSNIGRDRSAPAACRWHEDRALDVPPRVPR